MCLDVKQFFLVASAIALTACSHGFGNDSFLNNDESAYLTSSNGRQLIVSEPLTRAYLTRLYQLPNQTRNPQINIAPSDLQNKPWTPAYVPGLDFSKIKHVEHGILVDKPMGQTWSIVGSALRRKSIPIAKVDSKKMIYFLAERKGTAAKYRLNFYPKGDYQTLIILTDLQGQPLDKQQLKHIRASLVKGMQGKTDYSIGRLFGYGE